MPERAPTEQNAERFALVEKIYQAALAEHQKFKEVPEAELREVVSNALREIEELEKVADSKLALKYLTPEVAEKLSALWVFSGPGTYDSPTKGDRYEKYPWAAGMDRARLSYAAWLGRKSAEITSGQETPRGSIQTADERKIISRQTIATHAPTIIYNGTAEENAVVQSVPEREGIIVPKEKVLVVGEGITNTVDQIKTFILPENLHHTGNEIGLVSHAPHLMRVLHMMKRYPTLPEDMSVRVFPIAAPAEGREEYVTLEIKGLLYYIYLSANHDADKETRPYTIHGKEN